MPNHEMVLEWSSPLVGALLVFAAMFIGLVLIVGYTRKPRRKRGKHE